MRVHNGCNVGIRIPIWPETCSRLCPIDLAFRNKTMWFGPTSEIDVRNGIFTVLVGMPDDIHQIFRNYSPAKRGGRRGEPTTAERKAVRSSTPCFCIVER